MAELSKIREERMQQLYEIVERAGEAGVTLQQIAKALPKRKLDDGSEVEMTVTPYLTGMVDEMVKYGWARKEQGIIQTSRGARMGWRYYFVPPPKQ